MEKSMKSATGREVWPDVFAGLQMDVVIQTTGSGPGLSTEVNSLAPTSRGGNGNLQRLSLCFMLVQMGAAWCHSGMASQNRIASPLVPSKFNG